MARERLVDGEIRTSVPAYDDYDLRVWVAWGVGMFTYHYVPNVEAAIRYLRIPGPTVGAMAAGLSEYDYDCEDWTEWYSQDGIDIDEVISEREAVRG